MDELVLVVGAGKEVNDASQGRCGGNALLLIRCKTGEFLLANDQAILPIDRVPEGYRITG
jgi:hypothetical protein